MSSMASPVAWARSRFSSSVIGEESSSASGASRSSRPPNTATAANSATMAPNRMNGRRWRTIRRRSYSSTVSSSPRSAWRSTSSILAVSSSA